jgi:hypothetical protein
MPTTTPDTSLTLLDRCDRCGAAAKLRLTLEHGELLFCTHHSKQYGFVDVHPVAP